jgi:hypothetical protein
MRSLALPVLALVVALAGCSAVLPKTDDGASVRTSPATQTPTPTAVAESIGYADLANAAVPSLCDFAAGTLQNGKYAGDLAAAAPPDANAQYAQYFLEDDQEGVHWVADPDAAAGEIAAVSAVYCDWGGVSWPESLVAYDRELGVVASANLLDILSEANSTIRSLALHDGRITVVWDTQGPDDPSAAQSVRATATLVPSGAALVADGTVLQVPAPANG